MISIPNDEWKEYYATLKENYIKSVLIKKHFNLQLTDSLVTLKQYSSQISLLISSEFMRIHQLLFPLKSLKNHWFSDDFRGNSSQLIHLNFYPWVFYRIGFFEYFTNFLKKQLTHTVIYKFIKKTPPRIFS